MESIEALDTELYGYVANVYHKRHEDNNNNIRKVLTIHSFKKRFILFIRPYIGHIEKSH